MSETKELFRKSALERLASPERYDKLVTLARSRLWPTLVATGVLVALAVACWDLIGPR